MDYIKPMSNRRQKIKIILLVSTLLLAIGTGLSILLPQLLHLDNYKDDILAEVQQALHRQVTYEKGDVSFRFGPTFSFTKVAISDRDNASQLLTAEHLVFKIALMPLLEKRVVITQVHLDQPAINLSRTASGELNISDLLESKEGESPIHLNKLTVSKGRIVFSDKAVAPEGIITSLDDTNLELKHPERGKNTAFSLSTSIIEQGKRSTVVLSGSVKLTTGKTPLSQSKINARIYAKDLNPAHFWSYYSRYVPFEKPGGRLDIEANMKGTFADFSSKTTVRIHDLLFVYPQVFHATISPKEISCSCELDVNKQRVAVKDIHLSVDGLSVQGNCSIKDIGTGDPLIVSNATIPPFRLEQYAQYIPYGIIATDASEFIEQHIKGGIFRLDEGRLSGRVSQILHMEKDQNYNVLYIRARALEGGLLTFGSGVPTFNSIKGELELAGKDFSLKGMSGKFGTSPFTLDGKITDYPLDVQSGYPFTMTMTPQAPEAAWLLQQGTENRLGFSGNSTLLLSGSGFTSGYTLTGEWNLTNAAYSYPDIINKPAATANRLTFRGVIDKEGFTLSTSTFSLPPLVLSASAAFHPTGNRRLSFDLHSNQFQLATTAPMFPRLRGYHPTGNSQAAVHGESSGENLADIRWKGDVTLAGVSFKPSPSIKQVSNINGTIHFKGDTLETTQLAATLGSSTIYGKGTLSGFKEPALTLDFSSPALNVADIGLHHPQHRVLLKKVQGSATLHDNDLHISSLAAEINNSAVKVKGNVYDLRNPVIELTAAATHLDLDDILLVTGLEKVRKDASRTSAPLALKLSLTADTAKLKDIQCKKLQSSAVLENNILYLQPVEFTAYGGKFSAKVRLDFGSNGSPRSQVGFVADKINSEQLLQSLGWQKALITGALSMRGNLTAKGDTFQEMKKSALGNVDLHLEDGKLRKFSVLSKIFSILNVAQLLKFQLPDMVSGGMPYNEINAKLSFSEGTLSSSDLFVNSDAMNISAVGKIDLVSDKLDVTVGVQPLQTVDKVVSHIPIVGWILTGKDKSLISTYFEATGRLDDPAVKAIPVKSVGKGVFDIFKRVFQLPAKLITDTGEVIINK